MQEKIRDHTFDALRTLAILLMISSHTTRMIAKEVHIFWNDFVLLIEPFTASSFLFLVGTSLVLSYKKGQGRTPWEPQRWFLKKIKRSVLLWIISFFIYFISVGLVWSDSFVLSGILATIAYAISVYSLLLILPLSMVFIISFTTILTVIYIVLDRYKIYPYFLLDGNFPVLPLILFTGIGVLFAIWLPLLKGTTKKLLLLACILCCIISGILWGPQKVFSKPLGRYGIKRKVEVIFSPRKPSYDNSDTISRTISYYNLRPALLPVISSILILFYFLLTSFFRIIEGVRLPNNILKKILALGRHSLDIYILHLILLGVFIGKKSAIKHEWQGALTWILVTATCYTYALIKEEFTKRKLQIK